MALPIIETWKSYFEDTHEGLGSSYERVILNDLLFKIIRTYKIESVLEAPIFGFTGITGINSVGLSKSGCNVTLLDHSSERLEKVKEILNLFQVSIHTAYTDNYLELPFTDLSFDMSWNFSALWFAEDNSKFLSELSRVTKKLIFICVPNQHGIGYKWQKANTEIPHDIIFNEENINPVKIKEILKKLNWNFIAEDYIDCPLWPDIGMSKEKFLGKYISLNKLKNERISKKSISIIDYYKGIEPDFPNKMRRYSFFEKYAPEIFKMYWSHHHWLLFLRPNQA